MAYWRPPMVLLTSADAAVRLGVQSEYIRKLARDGRIQAAAVSPRGQHFYSEEEIARYQRERDNHARARPVAGIIADDPDRDDAAR